MYRATFLLTVILLMGCTAATQEQNQGASADPGLRATPPYRLSLPRKQSRSSAARSFDNLPSSVEPLVRRSMPT